MSNSENNYTTKEPLAPEPTEAQILSNLDRLEKKKNREKRRRSEVNERFDELIEVMEEAQAQVSNAPSFGDFSKGVLTKAGLLEKAVDLVKILSDENKKLKMMIQSSSSMPMLPPSAPVVAQQNWMPAHPMSGYGNSMRPAMPMVNKSVDYYPFMGQLQQPFYPMAPVAFNGNKATVLNMSDMLQLGDWSSVQERGYCHGSSGSPSDQQKSTGHEKPDEVKGLAVSQVTTHAECA